MSELTSAFFVPVRGKAAKRRRWRKKRAGFEEAPRVADAKRHETGNGATVVWAVPAHMKRMRKYTVERFPSP